MGQQTSELYFNCIVPLSGKIIVVGVPINWSRLDETNLQIQKQLLNKSVKEIVTKTETRYKILPWPISPLAIRHLK